MDFTSKLPTISRKHDSIIIVVDKLFKATHFIPVKSTHKTNEGEMIFMKKIFKLYGLPKALYLIEIQILHLTFGKVFLQIWVHS